MKLFKKRKTILIMKSLLKMIDIYSHYNLFFSKFRIIFESKLIFSLSYLNLTYFTYLICFGF
jgi:hypothetical protein